MSRHPDVESNASESPSSPKTIMDQTTIKSEPIDPELAIPSCELPNINYTGTITSNPLVTNANSNGTCGKSDLKKLTKLGKGNIGLAYLTWALGAIIFLSSSAPTSKNLLIHVFRAPVATSPQSPVLNYLSKLIDMIKRICSRIRNHWWYRMGKTKTSRRTACS